MHARDVRRVVRCGLLALTALVPAPAASQAPSLPDTLAAVADYVEQYLTRVQSIVGQETVIEQPLGSDFQSSGRARTLVFDLHLDWTATAGGAVPQVRRDLVTVNGRPPRPTAKPECLDPRALSPEPLEFLRPEGQARFTFTTAGRATIDRRPAWVIDYRARAPQPVEVEWKDHCATFELPGRTRGRLWVDVETAAVLRVDEGVIGLVDVPVPPAEQGARGPAFMTVERADTSIRYRPVRFDDPEETLLLPHTIESVTVIRNSGMPRLRVRHEFRNYRRFVTGDRLLP